VAAGVIRFEAGRRADAPRRLSRLTLHLPYTVDLPRYTMPGFHMQGVANNTD